MMRNIKSIGINESRSKRTVFAVAIVFLLSALAALILSFPIVTARAAGKANTVTLHVYDAVKEYDNLGTWVWVQNSSGIPTEGGTLNPNEQFKREGEDNTAYSFDTTFTDAQIAKLKSGLKLGFLVCSKTATGSKVWGAYNKETSDVFVDISNAFDSDNHADVYYVRGDTVAYTDVEEAKMAFEKVKSAKFIRKSANSVTVELESTTALTKESKAELYLSDNLIAEASIAPDETGYAGTVVFNNVKLQLSGAYTVKIKGINAGAIVSMAAFIDDLDFIKTFESKYTQDCKYGAFYTPQKTTFRLWAPFASSVTLNLYTDGISGDPYSKIEMWKMTPVGASEWGGIWERELSIDVLNMYYTYTIDNGGVVTEAADPYAKACGANGYRSMVVDLKSTDPVGWDKDKHLYAIDSVRADTPMIWEIQVDDFSKSPDSGMKYKGKYLAFTEKGTTVPGKSTLKTGVDYLRNLGVTYVQLNPVYDFLGVDETDMSIADDTKDTYNWGYNPQNYNVPEGTYSTDPFHGDVRIKEFKQMVKALHDAKIGVIMDVVYNHTCATGGQAFQDTVPNYYHRMTNGGAFTDGSGCGNETASERSMVRKYIVESISYWATEYHIDGFRLDLMGLHDVTTIKAIRDELDSLDNGKGKKLLMYGEPWSGDSKDYTPDSFKNRVKVTGTTIAGTGKYTYNGSNNILVKQLRGAQDNEWWFDLTRADAKNFPINVGIFGDTGRDGLRGNNDPGTGWANNSPHEYGKVQKLIEGYCGGEGAGIITRAGSQAVCYASAHDNYTLYDQLKGKKRGTETPLYYENNVDDTVARCKLIASALFMSSGVPFMLAGDEMGRTKYGNENSYNSSSKVNQIVWSRQENFKDLVEWYSKLIKMRLANNSAFSYQKSQSASNCYGNFTGTDGSGKIVYKHGNISLTLDPNKLSGDISDGKTTIGFNKNGNR